MFARMRFVCFDDVVSLRRALLHAGEGKGSVGVDASAGVFERRGCALLKNLVSLRLLPRHSDSLRGTITPIYTFWVLLL